MMRVTTLAFIAATLALTACGHSPLATKALSTASAQAQARSAYATVLAPADVPAAVVQAALGPAQAEADAASKRRQIDSFTLPNNPVGMAIGDAHVLTFIGAAQHDLDLNVELRALVSGAQVGVTLNYSGLTTQSRLATGSLLPKFAPDVDPAGTTFELITGTPGSDVADAYSDYMNNLAQMMTQQYQAQAFQFDDTPIVFAVHQGSAVTGFVLTNQGNNMVLGERKNADVQNVACYTVDGKLAAAYTVVGFNRKISKAGAGPSWHLTHDADFGTFARCGSF